MRKMFALAAVAASMGSAPALAALPPIVSTTVTASNGNYGGSLASLTDGIQPANGSTYNNAATEVFFGANEFVGTVPSFTFNFGGLYSVENLLATVDNNDDYKFELFNGTTLVGTYSIASFEGIINNGVETFSIAIAPVLATSGRVSASGGDSRYSLGEVQFRGNLVSAAVPEPATWAMMLLGFGGIGFAMRRTRKAALQAA